MRRKWIGFGIAGLVLAVLVGAELTRGFLRETGDEHYRRLYGTYTPPFRPGDLAPDFELPDAAGRRHSLASLVRRDTLLCFLCGCEHCRTMQTYLGEMLRSLGPRAPAVISVSTAPPEAEAAWKRDTGIDQVILYEPKTSKPVTKMYRGDPCPRVFRLAADRRVTWYGPSPAQVESMDELGVAMARNLGYRVPIGRDGRPTVAPGRN